MRRQKLVQKYITRLKFHVSYGLYSNVNWTEVYNPNTQCWKTTGTPCSCYLCKGNDTIEVHLRNKQNLKWRCFKLFNCL